MGALIQRGMRFNGSKTLQSSQRYVNDRLIIDRDTDCASLSIRARHHELLMSLLHRRSLKSSTPGGCTFAATDRPCSNVILSTNIADTQGLLVLVFWKKYLILASDPDHEFLNNPAGLSASPESRSV